MRNAGLEEAQAGIKTAGTESKATAETANLTAICLIKAWTGFVTFFTQLNKERRHRSCNFRSWTQFELRRKTEVLIEKEQLFYVGEEEML